MRRIVFAKTDWVYESYADLWRLVELAGFPTCRVSEIDLTQPTLYVTTPFTGETRQHLTHRRSILAGPAAAHVVWWNLERPDSDTDAPGEDLATKVRRQTDAALALVDGVWVSDRSCATLDPRQQFVILGSDARLAGAPLHPNAPKSYDIVHLSYVTHRRKCVYDALERHGVRLGPNGWGAERDATLRASRLMLNVHQTPAPVGEPLRFALAAAYALPLVTETLADPYPLGLRNCIMATVDDAVECVRVWLRDATRLTVCGRELWYDLCIQHPFRQEVERAAAEAHRDTR